MKIQTNVRAGAGQKRKSSADSVSVEIKPVYYPPVSRCTGI